MTTTSSAATNSVALVWYRVGDLRVSDHEPLHLASQSSAVVVPFFCLDDTYLRPVAHPGALGLPSTGPHRLTAMLRAVESLQASLRDRGSDLLCSSGSTVDTLQQLVQALAAEAQRPDRLSLYYYSFPWDASLKEGKNVEGRTALEEAVVDGFQRASAVHGMHAEVHTCWSGSTLYHKDDVMAMSAHSSASSNARNPLEMIANGGSMTDVRRAMQLGTSVRPSLPQPLHMPPVPCSLLAAPLRGQMNLNVGSEGCLRQLYDAAGAGMALITLEQLVLWSLVPGSDLTGCTKEQTANPSPNRPPVAGTVTEAEVTARLKWMLHPDSPFMLGYKDSRMMAGGEDSSAMLSISLSLGTISPRTVYWETLHAMHAVLPRAEGAKGKIPGCGEDGNEWTWREPDSASPGHHWLLMHLGIQDFFLYYSLVHGQGKCIKLAASHCLVFSESIFCQEESNGSKPKT